MGPFQKPAEVSFRNFRFPPSWAFAPILQTDAPHIIAAAQIFFDQTGSESQKEISQ